jgi:outer membrane lipoprotein-sorting protein
MSIVIAAAVVIPLLSHLQDDPTGQARLLIEKLRSDDSKEREEASKKLLALGEASRLELERATKDPDSEVARRAGATLESINAQAAKEALQDLEAKLLKAKSVSARFSIKADGTSVHLSAKGTLQMAHENRVRIESKGVANDRSDDLTFISDGARTYSKTTDQWREGVTHKDLSENIAVALARPGFLTGGFGLGSAGTPKVSDLFTVSGLRRGPEEKIDNRPTRSIIYEVHLKESDIQTRSTLWLDVKTGLPVKRVSETTFEGKTMTCTERYEDLTLDGDVDEKQFVAPK